VDLQCGGDGRAVEQGRWQVERVASANKVWLSNPSANIT
jgi:hypothetical protein